MRRFSAAVSVVAALSGCTKTSRAPEALAGLQSAELSSLQFTVAQEPRQVKDHKVSTFHARLGDGEIQLTRIENFEAGQAAQMLEQRKFQVESLYREEKSPYPGYLSKSVKCPKEFLPDTEFIAGERMRVRAAANARKSLGVCDPGEMKSIAVQLYLYCPAIKTMLQIESYLPKSETTKAADHLRQVSC